MVRIILLIGVQGSGKTWTLKELIERYNCTAKKKVGKIRYHSNGELLIVGKYDGSAFEGSDKLSMAIMNDYDLFMQLNKNSIIVMEGDRFTNNRVINHELYAPFIIKITDDGKQGRLLRGTKQSEEVIKRMQTRITNISPDIEVCNSQSALDKITNLIDKYEVH